MQIMGHLKVWNHCNCHKHVCFIALVTCTAVLQWGAKLLRKKNNNNFPVHNNHWNLPHIFTKLMNLNQTSFYALKIKCHQTTFHITGNFQFTLVNFQYFCLSLTIYNVIILPFNFYDKKYQYNVTAVRSIRQDTITIISFTILLIIVLFIISVVNKAAFLFWWG